MQRTMKISEFTRDVKTALGRLADDGIPIELERRGTPVATVVAPRAVTNYRDQIIRRARDIARRHHPHDTQRAEDALDTLVWFAIHLEPIHDHTGQPLNAQDTYDRIKRSIVGGMSWGEMTDRIELDIRADLKRRIGGTVAFRLDESTMHTVAAATVDSFGFSWDDAQTWGLSADEVDQVAALWNVDLHSAWG